MDRPRKIALACAGIAAAVSGLAVAANLSTHQWRPSALVRAEPTHPVAPIARWADANFAFVSGHYDGVYNYVIALDPFARDRLHSLIEKDVYRYGHPGYGWLASIMSFGRASAAPTALMLIGLAGMALGAWAASRLAAHFGWSPWAGLFVALSPGLIFAVTVDTAEPLGVAVATLGILAWVRRRTTTAGLLFVAACLIKEPFVFVPVGLALWELLRMFRRQPRPGSRPTDLMLLALGPVALVIWYVILRARFGTWPFEQTDGFLGLPVLGWIDTIRNGARLSGTSDAQIVSISAPLLVAAAAALTIGVVRAARVRSIFDAMFLPFLLLASMMQWWQLFYPKDAVRELVFVFLLLPAVLVRPRTPVAPEPAAGPSDSSETVSEPAPVTHA